MCVCVFSVCIVCCMCVLWCMCVCIISMTWPLLYQVKEVSEGRIEQLWKQSYWRREYKDMEGKIKNWREFREITENKLRDLKNRVTSWKMMRCGKLSWALLLQYHFGVLYETWVIFSIAFQNISSLVWFYSLLLIS